MSRPTFAIEDAHAADTVCGVDEVGRGPLAGPVVAAAVILRRDIIPQSLLDQINDSKKLTATRRAAIALELPAYAHISVAQCEVEEIDDINILQASLLAMKKAVEALPVRAGLALIDGNKAPKLIGCKTQTVVKGDSKSLSIAAASIIAKEFRDALMNSYAIEFPQYGWNQNAGYGTAQHLKAIQIHGVTRHHRRSFSPIANMTLQESSAKS